MNEKLLGALKRLIQPRRSIRSRLFWLLFGVALGAIALVNLVWLPTSIREIRQGQEDLRSVSLESVHDRVRQYLGDLERTLKNAALQFRVALLEGDSEGFRAIAQKLLQQQPAFEEIGMIGHRGREIFRLSRRRPVTDEELRDRSATALFREGYKTGIRWSPVEITNTSEPWVTLSLSVPSSDPQGIGMIFGVINLKWLWRVMGDFKLSKQGRVYVVDRKGRLIAAADPSWVLKQVSFTERPLVQRVISRWETPAASLSHGDYTNELGRAVAATGIRLEPPGWGIVVEQPQAMLYAEVREKIWFCAALSAAALLVSLVFAHFASGRLTQPIARLQEGADHIAAGYLGHRVIIETNDEIGQLAEHFNEMAQALRASREGLEEKIAERTKEISALYVAMTPLAGSDSIAETFEPIIEKLVAATGADAAAIRVVGKDKNSFAKVVQQGFPAEYLRGIKNPGEGFTASLVLDRFEPFISADLNADSRRTRKRQTRFGFNSCAMLPLVVKGEARGVIQLASKQIGYFTEEKKEYLMAIARLMGVVVENGELLQSSIRSAEQLKHSNQELSALYAALAPISLDIQVGEVLAGVIERLQAATGADAASIRMLDKDDGSFRYPAQKGFQDSLLSSPTLESGSADEWVFMSGQPIVAESVARDPRIKRKRQLQHGFHSCALLPLVVRKEVRGIIHLASRQTGYFSEEKSEYLMAIARLMGIVIENHELLESSLQFAEELKQSNMELEQFAYVASHDLQEPLRMITGYTQLLEKRYGGRLDQTAKEYIGFAVDGAKRMQGLIQDLLTYSRVGSAGKTFAWTNCEEVLRKVLAGIQVAVKESGAKVTHDPLPTVLGDDIQLGQLLQNLIGNAIKYRDSRPPEVHVSCRQKEEEWVFSVRDNGIGIGPEYGERIFQIFQRLHTRSEYEGTGIGLALCKKIIERHGGRIWVESESGKGSTFYFTIPMSASQPAGIAAEANA